VFWKQNNKAYNKVATVPAPIGGLNARDSLAAMPPSDAVVIQNWWPQPYGLTVRKGYKQWATGMAGTVGTLAAWNGTDGDNKLFSWADDSLWDVTLRAAVGSPALTGLQSSYWSHTNFVNAADSYLIAVNGLDDAIIIDSGGVDRIVAGNGTDPLTWDGIDPEDCSMIIVHQYRIWVIEKGTANGWFLPPDAIQGTFKKVDFGPLFSRGGYLQALATWTIDDGNGAEDHLVAVSSEGEVVVYQGSDPEDDTKWALVGVYYVGAPVAGNRFVTKMGGDLGVLCQQGVVSLAAQLVSTKVNRATDPILSNKIQFLLSDLISAYGALEGWELHYFPKINMLLINVPSIVEGGNVQLVANQIISSWSIFQAMDAATWAQFNDQPYFGNYDGTALQAWEGNEDNVDLDDENGEGIIANVQQAYSYLDVPATQKQVSMYRPTFVVNNPVTVSSAIFYDFRTLNVPVPGEAPPKLGSLWGSGLWNSAIWGGGSDVQKQWIQAQGIGVAASLGMSIQTTAEVLWVATDYSYVAGVGLL